MNRTMQAGLVAIAALARTGELSASDTSSSALASTTMPPFIDVCLTSAVIAPSKADGSPWDAGGGKLTPQQVSQLDSAFARAASLLSKNPAGIALEIANIFKLDIAKALAKPDVFGTIEFAPQGAYAANGARSIPVASPQKPAREFQPSFGTTVCLNGVAWHKEMRLRLSLTDKDLVNDDRIGTVEVVASDIEQAFQYGKGRHVFVGDQDTHQVKFAVVSVTKGVATQR
jgi:hypothetical protein